jgi:aryl-alcohol dehydrogenase-like predicted oxidoreductase
MLYRQLGKTGLEISVLGYGAWGIGGTMWIGADDDESLRALRRAIELGDNFIDTAHGYGKGHSEQLVGQVLRDASETVYVATKIPPKNRIWPAPAGVSVEETYPADWIVRCTEESLERLGVETIDVQQFHVWSDEWVGRGDWLEAIEQLKRDGKIRFFGVSINDHQPTNAVRLVESGHVDTVQVIYNIFDQSPEDELFPAVQAANVGVIVRVPFDEGSLTGRIRPDTEFPEGDSAGTTSAVTGAGRSGIALRRLPLTSTSRSTTSPRSRCASASRTRRCRARSRACGRWRMSSGTSRQ